jgi:type IV secretion system protein VirD4
MPGNHFWQALSATSSLVRQVINDDYTHQARIRAYEVEASMRQARPSGLLGDGRLADLSDAQAADLFNSTGLFLGALDGRMLFYSGEGPLLMYSRTRGGKGRDIILPNLAHVRDRSLVIVDNKDGENAYASAEHREKTLKIPCIFLNFFELLGLPNTRINPLRILTAIHSEGGEIGSHARAIAKILLPSSPKSQGDDWSRKGAQRLITMFMEYAAKYDEERCTLSGIWRFLNSDKDQLEAAFALIAQCDHEALRRKAGAFERVMLAAPKQFEAYRDDAAAALESFEPGTVFDRATSGHDFDVAKLKQSPHTIYLILDSEMLDVAAPCVSLIINYMIETIARAKGPITTTFILDEFAQLPPSPAIMKCLRLYSGKGVQLFFFAQGRFSMEDRWSAEAVKEMEDQAAIMLLKGVLQPELMRDLELWSGRRTVLQRGVTHNGGAVESANANLGETSRSVLQSEDIMRLSDRLILRVAGMARLLVADPVPFFEVTPWKNQIRDVRKLHRGEEQ